MPSRQNFYPRSPRGERLLLPCVSRTLERFLSTLPARGATIRCRSSARERADFYPRSPRGERRHDSSFRGVRHGISIHAPREGSDIAEVLETPRLEKFLSTLPARGATTAAMLQRYAKYDFYPRSPRGERPQAAADAEAAVQFLSTLPARGATDYKAAKGGTP